MSAARYWQDCPHQFVVSADHCSMGDCARAVQSRPRWWSCCDAPLGVRRPRARVAPPAARASTQRASPARQSVVPMWRRSSMPSGPSSGDAVRARELAWQSAARQPNRRQDSDGHRTIALADLVSSPRPRRATGHWIRAVLRTRNRGRHLRSPTRIEVCVRAAEHAAIPIVDRHSCVPRRSRETATAAAIGPRDSP